MAKHKRPKTTPTYAALNGPKRYEVAKQLAATIGVDESQILFTYLKVMATTLPKMAGEVPNAAEQAKVDIAFEQALKLL